MRDDNPRSGSKYARYSGFESGLRTAGGKVKLAYAAFRLPLVAELRGKSVYFWGLARPAGKRTRVLVQIRKRGSKKFVDLRHVTTNSSGYWRSRTGRRSGAVYRVVWGKYAGPATRAY
jgi:hypothetical protein